MNSTHSLLVFFEILERNKTSDPVVQRNNNDATNTPLLIGSLVGLFVMICTSSLLYACIQLTCYAGEGKKPETLPPSTRRPGEHSETEKEQLNVTQSVRMRAVMALLKTFRKPDNDRSPGFALRKAQRMIPKETTPSTTPTNSHTSTPEKQSAGQPEKSGIPPTPEPAKKTGVADPMIPTVFGSKVSSLRISPSTRRRRSTSRNIRKIHPFSASFRYDVILRHQYYDPLNATKILQESLQDGSQDWPPGIMTHVGVTGDVKRESVAVCGDGSCES